MVKTIGFVENKGQILNQFETPNQEVKYLLHGNGMNVQLKKIASVMIHIKLREKVQNQQF